MGYCSHMLQELCLKRPKDEFTILKPPSNTKLCPLTYPDSSLPKYNAAKARSSAVNTTPLRFAKLCAQLSISLSSLLIKFVVKDDASANDEMQLTRITYCPSSAAPFFEKSNS